MAKLSFSYDEEHDIMTIEGTKYTGELLRLWGDDGIVLYLPFMLVKGKRGIMFVNINDNEFVNVSDLIERMKVSYA